MKDFNNFTSINIVDADYSKLEEFYNLCIERNDNVTSFWGFKPSTYKVWKKYRQQDLNTFVLAFLDDDKNIVGLGRVSRFPDYTATGNL